MRIERHVFGSFSGYTTLARSGSVSKEDCRALESGAYAFGQSNDPSVLRGLAREPSYFTRILGGRRGLTRVLEGNQDDNGRPTVLLITAIISQADWDTVLCGDVQPLLDAPDLWKWDGTPALPPMELMVSPSPAVPRKIVPKVLALISELERCYAARRTVVVNSDDYGLAEIRAAEMLLPAAIRSRANTAYRSFNPGLPVSVNCVATNVAGAKSSFHFQNGSPLSPYASMLNDAGVATGILPLEQIAAYRNFGASPAAAEAAPAAVAAPAGIPAVARAPIHVNRGAPAWVVVALVVACLALAITGFVAGNSMGQNAGAIAGAQEQEKKSSRALIEQADSYEQRVSSALGVKLEPFDKMLNAAADKIRDAESKAIANASVQPATTTEKSPTQDHPRKVDPADEKYRSFYEAAANRQRERFYAMQKEITDVVTFQDWNELRRNNDRVHKLNRELKEIETDWPLLSDGERKWIQDLKMQREKVQELAEISLKIERTQDLLRRLEESVSQVKSKVILIPVDELRDQIRAVRESNSHIPENLAKSKVDVGSFRKQTFELIEEHRKWLEEYEKSVKPKENPKKDDKTPKGDNKNPRAQAGGWEDRIRKFSDNWRMRQGGWQP